jgi:phage recombination protein Bet
MNNKMNNEEATVKNDKMVVEYVPLGALAQDKIKLSVRIVIDYLAEKTKSGKVCSERDAVRFIGMCTAKRLNPWENDSYLVGFDTQDGPKWSLITSHQAFLKRAECNPEYDGMQSGIVVERNGQAVDIEGDLKLAGDKLLGGWAKVFFKNRKYPMYKRIALATRRKSTKIWMEDEPGMIVKCSEADALRSSFPTFLGGLYLAEERHDQDSVIEITEPKIDEPRITPEERGEPPQQPPAQDRSTAPKVTPARKKATRLKVKPDPEHGPFESQPPPPPSDRPNRDALLERLKVGGYTEKDFLWVANHNEWLGPDVRWETLEDGDDDFLAVFLIPEEWDTVQENLEKMPRHTKD